jgi:hypothetical protein
VLGLVDGRQQAGQVDHVARQVRHRPGVVGQRGVEVGEHGGAVVGRGGAVEVGWGVRPERHREAVALVRARRQLAARRDDRRAPGDQVAGGGHLLAQPVDPGRHQPGRPRRHPRHDRRGPQVHAQGEEVVQHHRLIHAQAV